MVLSLIGKGRSPSDLVGRLLRIAAEGVLMERDMEVNQFLNNLRQSPRPVVVDFWAPWCLPCRAIQPALQKLEERYAGKVDLLRVNADENRELIQKVGILSIPTLVIYRNGEEVFRKTGAQSEAGLASLFESALTGDSRNGSHLGIWERALRAGIGTILFIFAFNSGSSLWMMAAAGLFLFSSVYDRCPIWRAITPKVKAFLTPASKSRQEQG
jgi:thioredoxin